MEQNAEGKVKNAGGNESNNNAAKSADKSQANAKRNRILQCLGNLNALYKVQGALLNQMEREFE